MSAPRWRARAQHRRAAFLLCHTRLEPPVNAAQIRARLAHPIVDADGQLLEFVPLVGHASP